MSCDPGVYRTWSEQAENGREADVKNVSIAMLAAAAAVLLSPSSANAQGMPTKAEIVKKIKEAFPKLIEKSPEESIAFEGLVKLKYKKIPTDPKKIASILGQQIGGGQLPKGMDIDKMIGPFLPQIAAMLNEFLVDIGEFEALKVIKVRSKKIPVGKHRFGLVFNGEKPVGLRVFNKDKKVMKKPVTIKLKTKSTKLQDAVTIELKKPKKPKEGKIEADLFLACLRYKAKTKKPITADATEEKEDEGKKSK